MFYGTGSARARVGVIKCEGEGGDLNARNGVCVCFIGDESFY